VAWSKKFEKLYLWYGLQTFCETCPRLANPAESWSQFNGCGAYEYRQNMISSKKIFWTDHVGIKMRQYGLSKSKIMGVFRKPERKELGIAPGTYAAMQSNKVYSGSKKKGPAGEIWMMYKDVGGMLKIISAWRYPGVSKPGERIPIPEDIRRELLGE
jgi:hypothetical protein